MSAAESVANRESLINVNDILPSNFEGDCDIEIPEYAFHPDQWSKAFLRGLSRLDVEGKNVAEIGVGTGVNVIYLLRTGRPRSIHFSDKDARLAPLALENITKVLSPSEYDGKVFPKTGERDLADWCENFHQKIDLVYACIPQVILPHGSSINDGDNLAHYYESGKYDSDLHLYGLGLNDVLLAQAREFLPQGGSAVLNLGGRPGRKKLENLFRKNGFHPELIHQEMIAQHTGTSLDSLCALETATGHDFEFFADEDGKEPLNALAAEERRANGIPVFHRIYVYQGIKLSQ